MLFPQLKRGRARRLTSIRLRSIQTEGEPSIASRRVFAPRAPHRRALGDALQLASGLRAEELLRQLSWSAYLHRPRDNRRRSSATNGGLGRFEGGQVSGI